MKRKLRDQRRLVILKFHRLRPCRGSDRSGGQFRVPGPVSSVLFSKLHCPASEELALFIFLKECRDPGRGHSF